MASDIQPGDVVVCVAHRFNNCPNVAGHARVNQRFPGGQRLVVGRHYTVVSVRRGGNCSTLVTLAEVETPNPAGFCGGRFRKIEAPDTEIARRIKACQPMKQPVLSDNGGVR